MAGSCSSWLRFDGSFQTRGNTLARRVHDAAATIKEHSAALAELEQEVQRWADQGATLPSSVFGDRVGPQGAETSSAHTNGCALGSDQLNARLTTAEEPCSLQALDQCRAACERERKAHARA